MKVLKGKENLALQKRYLMLQLDPHFVFNSFSSLAGMIGENPKMAEDRLKRRCLNNHRLRYKLESENKPQSAKSTSNSGYSSLTDCRKSGRSTNIQMISYRKKKISE